MNSTNKALSVFALFLLSISLAYAQDYGLYSGKFYELKPGQEKIEFEHYNGTYNICENEKKKIPVLVFNNDAKTEKYSLDASGAGWAGLNAGEFSLPKKQSGVVFLELSPGKNTKGRYNIQINALSSVGGIHRDIILDVNVERCFSVDLELEKEHDKACGGEKKQYSAYVFNDGKQKSDIELNIKGPNWIVVDKNIFSIAPGNKEKFTLSADVPPNAKGIFDVAVGVLIKNIPSVKSENTLSIEAVPKYDCYKADIIADAKITNHYSNEYIPIKIMNSGMRQADYKFSMEAPEWISLEPKKSAVNPGQSANLNLNINPPESAEEGSYAIKINAEFEGIAYSKSINVVLSKNNFLKKAEAAFAFYQFYIYALLLIAIVLLIFRRQIIGSAKTVYKKYKIRRTRLKSLEAARKAKQLKKQIKNAESKAVEKAELEVKKIGMYRRKWILILIGITALILFSFFLNSKEFLKDYSLYFAAGIMIALLAAALVKFCKPLFRMLRKIDSSKKKR